MKSEKEITKEILETTSTIQEIFPELVRFQDEMTSTIPCEKNPVINAAVLKEYEDSLRGMAAAYASNSTKSAISSTVESQC
jgi:hypothetical protein